MVARVTTLAGPNWAFGWEVYFDGPGPRPWWRLNGNPDFYGSEMNLSTYETVYASFAPVPIPPAVYLFGSALGVMGWMRRKVSA